MFKNNCLLHKNHNIVHGHLHNFIKKMLCRSLSLMRSLIKLSKHKNIMNTKNINMGMWATTNYHKQA